MMLLYERFQSCTSNLGEISEWFYPVRGLHQGCPASSTNFILIVDITGHLICNNPKIKGITINNYQFKIAQFTDDTNLFLLHERETLQENYRYPIIIGKKKPQA